MEGKISFNNLSAEDKAALEASYGQQANYLAYKIKHIRELSPSEAGCLSKKDINNPRASILQTLYKINGNLSPLRFNRAVAKAVEQVDTLRTNYVLSGDRFLAVILNKRDTEVEINYYNLKNLDKEDLDGELRKNMEADIRQGFDLLRGTLYRFSVFNTQENEYAIIVTAVEPVFHEYDFKNIFRVAMNLSDTVVGTDILKDLKLATGNLSGSIREYWAKLLKNLPAPAQIPHLNHHTFDEDASNEDNYLAHIPRAIISDLRGKSESNKIMLMSILQTAWGFLLQETNYSQNVSFCLLVPQKKSNDVGPAAQSLVPILLNISADDNPTVKDIILKAFKQYVISQPYASLGREEIISLMGDNGEKVNHFLNFNDFFSKPQQYTQVVGSDDGKIVSQKHWDVRDVDLEIAFRFEGNQVILSVHYDGSKFIQNDVKILIEHYFLVLQQIITDWNLTYDQFMERLENRWNIEIERMENSQEDSRAIIQDGLSKIKLFQECEQGIIQLFMGEAKLKTKFEGDRLSEQELETYMVFVISGKVVRSIETGDGWYNTLDILKENSWVNENILLPEHRVHVSAEVLTEQATFLIVPVMSINTILNSSPILANNIIQHTLKQLEKYQRLWIQM